MAVITDEEKGTTVSEINLHADQTYCTMSIEKACGRLAGFYTICVAWQVMQCDSLTKVHCSLVKSLPVQ